MTFKRKTILLTVVRHGETDSNTTGVLQGQTNAPLSPAGQLQADRAGKYLENCQFDCAFSSDLERAFQTANTIIKMNKHKESTHDLKTNMLIREKSFGKLENMTLSEYSKISKNDGCEDEYQYAPEGGESPQQVRERVREFMNGLYIEAMAFENDDMWKVLLVSHAGWIRELIGYISEDLTCKGIPMDGRNEKGYHPFTPNTGITTFCLTLDEEAEHMIISAECTLFQSIQHLDSVPESQKLLEGI